MRQLLESGSAARVLGRSVSRVHQYEAEGKLPVAFRTAQGRRLFWATDVERLARQLQEREVKVG